LTHVGLDLLLMEALQFIFQDHCQVSTEIFTIHELPVAWVRMKRSICLTLRIL
jgi:hypothetical protein